MAKKKQKYVIPVSYEMAGSITIEATSIDEAISIAENHTDELPLPDDAEYIDGSYTVGTEEDVVDVMTKDAAKQNKYPQLFIPS